MLAPAVVTRTRRWAGRVGLGLVLVTLVSGCSHRAGTIATPTAEPRPSAGIVTGDFVEVGGFAPGVGSGRGSPLPGTLVAHVNTADGPSARSITVVGGRFFFTLAPGTYVLTGNSPQIVGAACVSPPVVVDAGRTVRATVACDIRHVGHAILVDGQQV